MKTNLLIFLALVFSFKVVYSQNFQLWGTTLNGGPNGGGTIFKINNDGSAFSNKYFFQLPYSPSGDLLQAQDNKLYGMTPGGGINGAGPARAGQIITVYYSVTIFQQIPIQIWSILTVQMVHTLTVQV